MSKPFRLGLTMAGAVSAGAYTGGVLDYLIQTLDAWELARQRGDTSVPDHEVRLDIISGASAGGITGAVAAVAFQQQRFPASPHLRGNEEELRKNLFYNTWVNLLDDDMFPHLLDESDVKAHGKLVSLLNSSFIDTVAANIIKTIPDHHDLPSYVHPQLELILTLSNLTGFKYDLSFTGEGSSTHSMSQHRDYAFFQLGKQYMDNGRIPLYLHEAIGQKELQQAAPATGAFPVGLAYRKLRRKVKYIKDNPYLIYKHENIKPLKQFEGLDNEEDYISYNVDGGMLNNEPFDLTMKLLATKDKGAVATQNAVDGEVQLEKSERFFDSSIIMIDPFPSDDFVVDTEEVKAAAASAQNDVSGKFPFSLMQVIGKIYKSMRGELLFKGEEIVGAFSDKDFSRFMIAPRRRSTTKVYNGSVAIACGSLDGFGGFLAKSFRSHDFFLGRHNCQSFLRKYFSVKLENNVPVNPIFAAGYSAEAIHRFRFQDADEVLKMGADKAPWYVPIVPDVRKEDPLSLEQQPEYPVYNISRFDTHKKAVQNRVKIISHQLISNRLIRIAFDAWFFFKKKWIYENLRDTIQQQLKKWGLSG